jgi:hypothetical protein
MLIYKLLLIRPILSSNKLKRKAKLEVPNKYRGEKDKLTRFIT